MCERAGELFPINYLQDFLRPLYLLLLSWKHDIIRIADNIFYLLIKLSQSGFLWHELKHVCSEMQYNKCYWKKKKGPFRRCFHYQDCEGVHARMHPGLLYYLFKYKYVIKVAAAYTITMLSCTCQGIKATDEVVVATLLCTLIRGGG